MSRAEQMRLSREATKKYTAAADDAAISAEIMSRIKAEDVLDYYEEGDALGEGAYGRVWMAEHLETGEQFAIKTIFDSGAEAQLGREVKVMLEANHPNLVKMHEVYQLPGGELHLVMDLVEPVDDLAQSDLFEWIMTYGALNTTDTSKLVYQTALSLKYLNESEGCIHRDLKPENILLGPEKFERIRVTDYGLARIFPEGIQASEAKAATANVGSDGYQAPETMNEYGDQTFYGVQCDIFSLGVITYIVCSATPPFGLGPGARRADIKAGKFKPMTGSKWDKVAPELKGLIQGMLKPKPEERITVDDILADAFLKKHAGIPDSPAAMEAALEANLKAVAKKV